MSANTGAYDLAIVGAGMAGSALAAALRGQGLSIALIEARPVTLPSLPELADLGSFDSRVSALNMQSIALLQQLGAWSAISDYRACAYPRMHVWDAEGTGAIAFDAAEVDCEALGYIVENRVVVHGLLQQVLPAPDIKILAPHSLQSITTHSEGVSLTLEGHPEVQARLLVAADGALSSVRSMLDFKTREWDYGHHAIVATVATSQDHENTAWQRFLPTGPLAFLPLSSPPGQHFCSVVWSLQDDLVEDVLALDDEAFCAELGRAFEQRLGPVLGCSARFAFPLRQRHAVDYVRPGVALVGDAAHTIHPLAGQGINMGFQDVAVMAAEIIEARRRGLSPGSIEVLRRYQRQRKGENLLMMGAMDGFKFLFEQDALPLRWLRNVGMKGVASSGPLKREIMRRAMGLGS
ncbi:UbiH/UbiF/VisC/COQ6 family ubiquinone biosynthesis hydroxylase [Sediminihaliea albiluteola]|uniref:UbiH/UbiF/VisC/COQ6 family ubiquinone biosynthesis hydroxylase n=1 Tax=Sediminihaliea albiluteola TaxID=2758564 RepID=UPI001F4839FB|nr:UbiH/UbiF/VisC/COQ6 family ubiquinone biosynthesis hydroxylase [Sediminihaliea albiluteola]